jgi:hypothetical protein
LLQLIGMPLGRVGLAMKIGIVGARDGSWVSEAPAHRHLG